MFMKKSICALSAAAIAAFSAMPAFADAAEFPVPEPDADGVYCHAGIVWQVRDQWDHRNELSLDALDETESFVIDCTHKDVNITGNGEYTVEMSGYLPDYEYDLGFFGVEVDLDFDTYADTEADLGPRFEITKVVMDGVEYTCKNELNEDGVHEQILEDIENGEGQKMIKFKNSWGSEPPSFMDPPVDNKIWTTADPITFTFTVSGLPTDKIEGYENETVEKVYGFGSTEAAAAAAEAEGGDSSVAEDTDAAVPTVGAEEESKAESKAAASSVKSSDSSEAEKEESSKLPLILGICGGVLVVAVVAVVLVKKK